MPKSSSDRRRMPLRSLAAKIVLLVLASTLVGALGVGWLSLSWVEGSVYLDVPPDMAVREAIRRVLGIHLVVALVACWVAYRVTSAVLDPITALSKRAQEVADGNFDLEFPEPRDLDEVGILTGAFNDMLRRIRLYRTELEARNHSLESRNLDLQQANEVLEQLSITDDLTKLHNHRFFQDHLTREIKRVSRSPQPLALLLIDIDDFKQLNDRFGHAAGDELLRRLARIMNDTVRESDLLARYGGEEFAVLASNTDREGAYQLAEKLRTQCAEASFILDDSMRPIRVTISIGVAMFGGNRKTFFDGADRALYRAKAEGKNCVIMDDAEDVV